MNLRAPERDAFEGGTGAEALRSDLSALAARELSGVAALDGSILPVARVHFARIAEKRRMVGRRRWAQLAAAAAIALLACTTVWLGDGRRPAVIAGDVTRDGTLDILDALALARTIDAGEVPDAAFDIDGDGRVNQRDVDAIAVRAVSLSTSGGDQARHTTVTVAAPLGSPSITRGGGGS